MLDHGLMVFLPALAVALALLESWPRSGEP
jgi:hypothetical protein